MGFQSLRCIHQKPGAKQLEEGARHPSRIREQVAVRSNQLVPRAHVPAPAEWSAQHAEALHEVQRRRAEAEARVRESGQARGNVLSFWRQMPTIPPDYSELTIERPFDGPIPHEPHEGDDEKAFRAAVVKEVRKERRWGFWKRVLIAVALFPCVFGGVGALTTAVLGPFSVLAALVAYVSFFRLCTLFWSRETRRLAEQRMKEQWPAYWRAACAAHEAYVSWPEEERQRVEWTRKVLAGDVDAVCESVRLELQAVEVPFESHVALHISDAKHAYIAVDLPELDDVVPELRRCVLWNGVVEETPLTKVERNQDYFRLVAGLALLVARTAFTAGPTLRQVAVAGFTQRRQRGSGAVEDEFVYEAVFSREDAVSWNPATVDSVRVLDTPTNRFDLGDDKQLRRIHPPTWWSVFTED
ncbi:hypothetical protein HPC49_19840 [Pyxidicoccus fallax]|uniref:Uncharacterized protein n=1 Tax=Pyxidicoccus fallax TaxID=394095 RepID=A0A848LDL6_9BACT|nr:hypothetical protein [Pyxidicoccus fallax]NMO17180.1 hypothetical protein [Pyxidicoccus fallax]NPC80464.1 hypothetical protein [Pyxidicoccus fallax]